MASDGDTTTCASDPNFAVICSFLETFGQLIAFDPVNIKDLQESIENTQEVKESLKDIHIKLLRRVQSIHADRWEKHLIKFCHQRGNHQDAWEIERFGYKKANITVKLRILKLLMEYQFTCNVKLKNKVNELDQPLLRLEPVGYDRLGRSYWLHVDATANLRLYREDNEEETWELIASDRDGLVKIINLLKVGSDDQLKVLMNDENSLDELSENQQLNSIKNSIPLNFVQSKGNIYSSNSEDNVDQLKLINVKNENQNDGKMKKEEDKIIKAGKTKEIPSTSLKQDNNEIIASTNEDQIAKECKISECKNQNIDSENIKDDIKITVELKSDKILEECTKNISKIDEVIDPKSESQTVEEQDNEKDIPKAEEEHTERAVIINETKHLDSNVLNKQTESRKESNILEHESSNQDQNDGVIEDPVVIVKGEGNGEDCQSSPFFLSEEIEEPVFYIFGKGEGFTCDTGNPEADDESQSVENVNSTNETEVNKSNEKIENELGNNDINSEIQNNDNLKHKSVDVFNLELSIKSSNKELNHSLNSYCQNDVDSMTNTVSNSKVEKLDELLYDSEAKDPLQCSSSSVEKTIETPKIQKKRNIQRIVRQIDDTHSINDPLRLDDELIKGQDNECLDDSGLVNKKSKVDECDEKEISTEMSKGKVKKKITIVKRKGNKILNQEKETNINSSDEDSDSDQNLKEIANKTKLRTAANKTKVNIESKAVKRKRNRNNSDSLMEEEQEEILSSKRIKSKSKKIVSNLRRKHTLKREENTDSSEVSIDKNKKKSKPVKKAKKKDNKVESKVEENISPVRQSRRLAQLKIKEEAERRQMEEEALKEMKIKHKVKQGKKAIESDWKASEEEDEEESQLPKKKGRQWEGTESSASDSDSDEFEIESELDIVATKSDHEFSPESDVADGETVPTRRARTLKEEERDCSGCKVCSKSEQPELILLCDACDDGYHIYCLKPLLFLVPVGDWYCPACSHARLIEALESKLEIYDKLLKLVTLEEENRKNQSINDNIKKENQCGESEESADKSTNKEGETSESLSEYDSSDDNLPVYRLRVRRQLPVSYRFKEYDQIMSSAIKEEPKEDGDTAAGNQGRGKDIQTIIEAAQDEKKDKLLAKRRRKPRKLNSLEVVSDIDEDSDEDFKQTNTSSTDSEVSSTGDDLSQTSSNDSVALRRHPKRSATGKHRRIIDSPELKKKKRVFASTSEDSENDDWDHKVVKKKHKEKKMRDRNIKTYSAKKKTAKKDVLKQYDSHGNVISRVQYGGLSDSNESHDWSPKHRTRQRRMNYTELPNTESEEDVHKGSGKHMPDSSDEFHVNDSEMSDSDWGEKSKPIKVYNPQALKELVKKFIQQNKYLSQELRRQSIPKRGRGSRRGRGGKRKSIVITEPINKQTTPAMMEKEKKRQEKETAKAAREAERRSKLEEKLKAKQDKEKQKNEAKQAKLAALEMKKQQREQCFYQIPVSVSPALDQITKPPMVKPAQEIGVSNLTTSSNANSTNQTMTGAAAPTAEPIPPNAQPRFEIQHRPRLQVRPERAMMQIHNVRVIRPRGALSIVDSPQPFTQDTPSIIMRMPHHEQQFRGPTFQSGLPNRFGPPHPRMYPPHRAYRSVFDGLPQRPQLMRHTMRESTPPPPRLINPNDARLRPNPPPQQIMPQHARRPVSHSMPISRLPLHHIPHIVRQDSPHPIVSNSLPPSASSPTRQLVPVPTESDRRRRLTTASRFPLGPYAPPTISTAPLHRPYLPTTVTTQPPAHDYSIISLQNFKQEKSSPEQVKEPTLVSDEKKLPEIKCEEEEPPKTGGVFEGLVSYFSSQQENDIDT